MEQAEFPLLSSERPEEDHKLPIALELLEATYSKQFAVSHANQIFMDISSNRKEKIIRALYLGNLAIRRMWESKGCLHYEVLSAHYFKELEYTKLYDIDPVREYTKKYIVMFNPWTLKYNCNCQFFSIYTDIDYCTHIAEVKLTNILKEYVPYFIYAYRFLLPHRCYKEFMSSFGHGHFI